MNIDKQLCIESLNGFLYAVSIIKSPERQKFYGAKFFEEQSPQISLEALLASEKGEISILTQRERNPDLRWLYREIENELSDVSDNMRLLLVDNIFYYFEGLFEEKPPTTVKEYSVMVKVIGSEISDYCEFEERVFAFQIDNDVLLLSFSERECEE